MVVKVGAVNPVERSDVVVNPILTVKLLNVATVAELKFQAKSVMVPAENPAVRRSDARYKFCNRLSV